ncbi:hypothetical protein I633_21991 (plasmid) [Alteromonas mediterranea 615]|uniref:Uncharacterized protein n=1 Tax=Alteromonas mediterranea 615 TaxID=1300253 RepID=S5AIW5_9ALTE|nr:hypothetical protein I633_21991 [Alteromonas mediterranea 615]
MNIQNLTKQATAFARDGDFGQAISILKDLIPVMAESGGFSASSYYKIIPYFQKAGRYQESLNYTKEVIIPAVIADRKSSHGHCVPEILQALTHNCISQIFNKLALAAKREGEAEHLDSFKALEQEHYDKYQVLLKIGEQKQLESEYQELMRVLGEDTDQWPLSIRRKFKL